MEEKETQFKDYVQDEFDTEIADIATPGKWASENAILAMAALLETDIYIYMEIGQNWEWSKHSAQILGENETDSELGLYINHRDSNHFEVVYDCLEA